MFDSITTHIKKFVTLTAEEEKTLHSFLRFENYDKREHLLKAGEICTSHYFVSSGILRMYNLNERGVEQVIHFAIEGWWLTDYFSYSSNNPSQVNIQAVEKAEVVIIDAFVQEELFEKLPQMERYFRMVLEKAYAASLMRTHYIFNFSAEERYWQFASAYPDFIQRVPQYLLASYLGFTPEFLSRMRVKKPKNIS